jgi:hypothetical protein
VAWTHFCTAGRAGLHEPVQCQVRYYHARAGVILRTVFADLAEVLEGRLAQGRSGHGCPVSRLPRRPWR